MSHRHPDRTKSMAAFDTRDSVPHPRPSDDGKTSEREGNGSAKSAPADTALGKKATVGAPPRPDDARMLPAARAGRLRRSRDRVSTSLRQRDPARYEILAEHGHGGLGRVYRAHDKELGRDVALKELIHPTYHSELRFIREARITAHLEHPGIVPVHEAGRWPDGTPFYSMKLVAGRPLSALLADAKTLEQRLAFLPHLIAVADAIAYAHDRRVIHRDLKPSNIIIGEFGETIVIDWGLAKDLAEAADDTRDHGPYRSSIVPDVTVTGSVLGTPAYMSPEQARGEQADPSSDVYSIGAILFQLCTASVPPTSASQADLSNGLRHVSEDLATIVLKSLSANQEDRYRDAAALASDLHAFDAGARIAARDYSLAAILGHWVRHHRRMTIAIVVPTIMAAALGSISVREILRQRDRASNAQREADAQRLAAEKQRDHAIDAQAALLLERDPTKARDLLRQRRALTADEALLPARADGAPRAEHVISLLPFKIWDAVADEELGTLAIAASDRKLRTINLATGRVEVVGDQLIEPPLLVKAGSHFMYTRNGRSGPELIRTGAGTHSIPLLGARQSTDNEAIATSDGLYLLGRNGELVLLSPKGDLQSVGRGFHSISGHRNGLLACTKSGLVTVIQDRITGSHGRCRYSDQRYPLATTSDGYVAQASPSTVVLYRNGTRSLLSIQEPNQFGMASSGLVVGIDDSRRTWYVAPTAVDREYGPSFKALPTALGANGNLAAWGDIEGVARVKDTTTGATWTFIGHSGTIGWIFVSERLRRVVTVGWSEVRVWRIPHFSIRPVAPLPCNAYTMASSNDGRRAAVTCSDGSVSLVDRDRKPSIRLLHRHENLAYGITWRDDEACSSSRDGKVICTDTVKGVTKVVQSHSHPIRWVHSAGSVLAYAVEDGGIWTHITGDQVPKLRYRHKAEPYRVAVNIAGDVASGALDGSVMLYERATGRVYSAAETHRDGVYQVHWLRDELITSSYDGTVRTWHKDLTQKHIANRERPIRDLEVLRSGWVANVGGMHLWLQDNQRHFGLDTGSIISDVAASTDGRFAVATAGSDLIVYDIKRHALAAIRLHDASAGLVHFVDRTTAFVFGSSGEISSVSVDALSFVPLVGEGEAYEEESK